MVLFGTTYLAVYSLDSHTSYVPGCSKIRVCCGVNCIDLSFSTPSLYPLHWVPLRCLPRLRKLLCLEEYLECAYYVYFKGHVLAIHWPSETIFDAASSHVSVPLVQLAIKEKKYSSLLYLAKPHFFCNPVDQIFSHLISSFSEISYKLCFQTLTS